MAVEAPHWLRMDIFDLEANLRYLRDMSQPTLPGMLGFVRREQERLQRLECEMRAARMASDETITAYLARIGLPPDESARLIQRRQQALRDIGSELIELSTRSSAEGVA